MNECMKKESRKVGKQATKLRKEESILMKGSIQSIYE
jgi:hypothetical protein